jgi:hypothetical protein
LIRAGRIRLIRFPLRLLFGVEVEEVEASPADPADLGVLKLKWILLTRTLMADHLVNKIMVLPSLDW